MPELNLGRVVGPSGKSAYQYAVEGGYTGTEAEFQALLGSGPWVNIDGPTSNVKVFTYDYVTLSGAQWRRILTSSVACNAIVSIRNPVSSGAATSIIAAVSIDYYNPAIQILQSSGGYITPENPLIDRLRLIGNDGEISLEYHYAPDFSNPVYVSALVFDSLHNVVKVNNEVVVDAPENKTVYKDVRVDNIPSGSVVTTPLSNPNLLDNWYFGTGVINQRGQTFYSFPSIGSQYTIDRWKLGKGSNLTLTDEGASLVQTANTYDSFIQVIEPNLRKYLTGKTVTLSALTKGGVGMLGETNGYQAHIPMSEDWTLSKITYTFRAGDTYAKQHPLISPKDPENALIVHCMKLEEGVQQTLAHKNASGNWVLNDPPPNPTLELLKCQRYQQVLVSPRETWKTLGIGVGASSNDVSIFIPTIVPLRANPTVEWGGPNWLLYKGDSQLLSYPVTSATFNAQSPNGVICQVGSSAALVEGQAYIFVKGGGTNDATKFILNSNI